MKLHLLCVSLVSSLLVADAFISTRIVGGSDATRGEYAWIASLQSSSGKNKYYHRCGASLVHPRFLLTAGHCTRRAGQLLTPDRIQLSEYDFGKKEAETLTLLKKDVKAVIPYPTNWGTRRDIALIELKQPIYNIPFMNLNFKEGNIMEKPGTMLRVIGWGYLEEYSGTTPTKLQEVDVPVVNIRKCKDQYGSTVDLENNICAGYYNKGGKDSCSGDSGGPLFYIDPKTGAKTQVGIVSTGKGCARKGYPGVYAKVSHFEEWLKSYGVGLISSRPPIKTSSPTLAPTSSPSAPPTGSPTKSPTRSPSASPTGSPTKSPTTSPSAAPSENDNGVLPGQSAKPTAAPTPLRTRCSIIGGNKGPVKKAGPCQFPFTFVHSNGVEVEFHSPPTVTKAYAWGHKSRDIDPEALWCPPLGVHKIDNNKKVNHLKWGLASCEA